MDEERLFRELGSMAADIKNLNSDIPEVKQQVEKLNDRVNTLAETRVSKSAFKWTATTLVSLMLALWGVVVKIKVG